MLGSGPKWEAAVPESSVASSRSFSHSLNMYSSPDGNLPWGERKHAVWDGRRAGCYPHRTTSGNMERYMRRAENARRGARRPPTRFNAALRDETRPNGSLRRCAAAMLQRLQRPGCRSACRLMQSRCAQSDWRRIVRACACAPASGGGLRGGMEGGGYGH